MPFASTWHHRGIEWTFSGDVTAAEIESANNVFFRDPRSDSARFQIIDLREVASLEWAERDIKATAAYDIGAESTIKNVRVAYITSDREVRSLLEKYVDISRRLNTSWQFRGFEDIESARMWARR